jgi:hypothetical protein
MRDGILEHIGLTAAELDRASVNIRLVHEDSKTGLQFADVLDKLLAEYKPDLVFVDPAFSYLGGDASSQKEVSPFLRNMLNPIIHRHGVGLWLNHHTNKPAAAKEKGPPVDLGAYLGAGSAEWCNWARAVIALRPVVNSSVFKFSAPKRGARLRWQDADGNTIFDRYIAHAREPGKIYWRDAEPDEIPDAPAPTALYTVQDLVNQPSLVKNAELEVQRAFLMDFFGKRNPAAKRETIRKALFRLIQKAVAEKVIKEEEKRLVLCKKAAPALDIGTNEEF